MTEGRHEPLSTERLSTVSALLLGRFRRSSAAFSGSDQLGHREPSVAPINLRGACELYVQP